jgi:hypothetical protein
MTRKGIFSNRKKIFRRQLKEDWNKETLLQNMFSHIRTRIYRRDVLSPCTRNTLSNLRTCDAFYMRPLNKPKYGVWFANHAFGRHSQVFLHLFVRKADYVVIEQIIHWKPQLTVACTKWEWTHNSSVTWKLLDTNRLLCVITSEHTRVTRGQNELTHFVCLRFNIVLSENTLLSTIYVCLCI